MRPASRNAVLSLLLCLCCPLVTAAQEIGTITLVEGPVRLIRGASMLLAGEGVRLHQGDILETASPGFTQLEFSGGTIVALGPSSRLFLIRKSAGHPDSEPGAGSSAAEMVLLSGWLKGEPGSKSGTYRYATPLLAATTREGTVVLHATGSAVEIFVESRTAEIAQVSPQGTPGHPVSAKSGQFFSRAAGKGVASSPNISSAFLEGMPRSFRDTLPARVPPPKQAEPKRAHEVTYSEIQPWLTIGQSWRRGFVERFQPRLKDAEFRKALEAHLNEYPEWDPVVHPEKYPPKNSPAAGNSDLEPKR